MIAMPWTVRRRRRERLRAAVAASGLFDEKWYLDGPRGAGAVRDPVGAFVRKSWRSRADPHPCFLVGYYRSQFPKRADLPRHPLAHYVAEGWKKGLRPNPVFDPRAYLERNPDLRTVPVEPLRHYLNHGWREGRAFHPSFGERPYREAFPTAPPDRAPLVHFLTEGWRTPSRSPRRRGEAGAFDRAAAELAPQVLPAELAAEAISMRELLSDWVGWERKLAEVPEPHLILFLVPGDRIDGDALSKTMNSLTRQVGGFWRLRVPGAVANGSGVSTRLRIIAERCPEKFRFGPCGEGGGCGIAEPPVVVEVLPGGEFPPDATLRIAESASRGDLSEGAVEGMLFDGAGSARIVSPRTRVDAFARIFGSGGTDGILRREFPRSALDYFSTRDPDYWSVQDYIAFLWAEDFLPRRSLERRG
ncbi:MAG: hypothetical protein ACLFRP_06270 [Puniceicoccaceae bacterium]